MAYIDGKEILFSSQVTMSGGAEPTGTIEITTNGEHDVTEYAKANVNVGGVDRLQWKCDNINSLQSEFANCKVSLTDVLKGLDVSNVKSFDYMFQNSKVKEDLVFDFNHATGTIQNMFYMAGFTSITLLNAGNLNFGTTASAMFASGVNLKSIKGIICTNVVNGEGIFDQCQVLESINDNDYLDFSNANKLTNCFRLCKKLVNLRLYTTDKLNATVNMFLNCSDLETIEGAIEMLNVTSNNQMFDGCSNLKNVTLKNIKIDTRIGTATGITWGNYITDESLINTAQELWDMTGSTSKTLYVSYRSNPRFDAIYVKLATPTAEQIANDQYIDNKKPCEVCESTDEGAMTLREYVVSKNWALA